MLDLTRYQAIIFDMDGTLIDSMPSHNLAWRQTCAQYGYPFDDSYMHSLGGVPTEQTVVLLNEKYGLSHNVRTVAQTKRQRWEQLELAPAIIPATVAVLGGEAAGQGLGGVPSGAQLPRQRDVHRDPDGDAPAAVRCLRAGRRLDFAPLRRHRHWTGAQPKTG